MIAAPRVAVLAEEELEPILGDLERRQESSDSVPNAVGGEVDFGVQSITNRPGGSKRFGALTEGRVPTIADEICIFRQPREPLWITPLKLLADELEHTTPGRDAGRRLSVEDESMGTLEREILVDGVRLLAVQGLDDPDVLALVLASDLLMLPEP